ncbi:MAG: alanine racemase [Hyphomicrobiaceae bacterium]|nr:alanine racemase [Hyphomicrobiaceae bacterium]
MDVMSKSTFLEHLDKTVTSDGCNMGSTAVLTVDLCAIGENYARLRALAKGAHCAAVVKADAYGTGVERVAPYLHEQGCKTFFVATQDEGILLRSLLPDTKIYILNGLSPGCAANYHKYKLCPVLGSIEMLVEWSLFCQTTKRPPSAALHIDSGMNRLGIGPDQLQALIELPELQSIKFDLIMSHLACADEPGHPRNKKQLQIFNNALKKLPTASKSLSQSASKSLANSAGIFLGPDYHFDILRPGIALYGGCPVARSDNPISDNPMKPVVTLMSTIVQIRTVQKGDAVGYGASFTVKRETRVATIPVGYADGYPRSLGASNMGASNMDSGNRRSGSDHEGAYVYIGTTRAPLLGRVSMDLITVDITDIPERKAFVGAPVELLGSHIAIDDLAQIADTIGYEILTSLGARYKRRYKEG